MRIIVGAHLSTAAAHKLWSRSGYLLDIFWIFVGYLSDICWIFVEYLLDICWIFVRYLLDVCWFCRIFANTFISFCSLKDTFCSSCQSGSVKLSVKFSQKKLGRGLKIIFAPAFTNPCSQKIPLHGWCLLVLYWSVLFRDKVLRLYKFPKSCFSWLVVNICLSENCQIGWGNVVFEK